MMTITMVVKSNDNDDDNGNDNNKSNKDAKNNSLKTFTPKLKKYILPTS